MTSTGARLRALRRQTGMSQAQMAAATGLSCGFVSLVESGQRTASPAALQSFASALGTSAAYLRTGEHPDADRVVEERIARAEAAMAAGDHTAAMDHLKDLDDTDVSHRFRRRHRRCLGLAQEAAGHADDAIATFTEALRLARTHSDGTDIAQVGMWLVGCYLEVGALDRAVEVGTELMSEVEALGIAGSDEHLRLGSTYVWATFERGDHMYAWVRAQELVAVAERAGSARARGSLYWNAALIAQARGRDDEGMVLAERALELLVQAGSDGDVPRMRYDYAFMLLRAADPQPAEALAQLRQAEPELLQIGSVIEVARWALESARAHLQLGELDAAEDRATEGLARLGGLVNLEACEGHIVLGAIAACRGDLPLAERRFAWAAERLTMMAASRRAATVWATLAACLDQIGAVEAAMDAKRRALTEAGVPSSAPYPTQLDEPRPAAKTRAAAEAC